MSSSRSYAQASDTFPFSHRAECRATLSAPELDRLTAALLAAQPETWRGDYYRLVGDPTPAPSPAGIPASRPDVDVVAMVRGGYEPLMADAPTVSLKLIAGGTSYDVVYEFGAFSSMHETVPAKIAELRRALDAATPRRCARK